MGAGGRRHDSVRRGAASTALVADDDRAVRALVRRVLEAEGWQVEEAVDGSSALASLHACAPDLLVLDVMMPGINGLDVLDDLRNRDARTGVIVLSAMGTEYDQVRGLDLGADDYMVKPFSPGELAARVRSVMRRRADPSTTGRLEFGDLAIDLATREVSVAEQGVQMTAREFDLLAFLASSPRQVFSREQLLDNVWSSSSEWQDAGTVTEHVRRVRRKIEPDPDDPRWIVTVRGVGYRFEP